VPALGGSLSFQGADRGARARRRARGDGRAREHRRDGNVSVNAFISPDPSTGDWIWVIWARGLANTTRDATSVLGITIPTLYAKLEPRLPRRIPALAGEPVRQGDPA
jgi:hypothetical protein